MSRRPSRSIDSSPRLKRVLALWSAVLAFVAVPILGAGQVGADGTERLGPPANGSPNASNVVVSGSDLQVQPATVRIDVPSDADIQEVWLLWETGSPTSEGSSGVDDTAIINGSSVVGTLIGGPTPFYGDVQTSTHVADITRLQVVKPGTNSLQITGIETTSHDGAVGIAVFYDDAIHDDALVMTRNGNDNAFVNFAAPLDSTVVQRYDFESSGVERTATLSLMAGSIADDRPRPHQLHIMAGGVETVVSDPFRTDAGSIEIHRTVDVVVPAGADGVDVWITSAGDGSDNLPASLVWIFSALRLPKTPEVLSTTTTTLPSTTTVPSSTSIPSTTTSEVGATTTSEVGGTTTSIPTRVKGVQLRRLPATGSEPDLASAGLLSIAVGMTALLVGARVRRSGHLARRDEV